LDDNTAIDLSAIASGTGGFVINGESAGDWSGISVSTAGDVNGDGLDDLLVGAHETKLSGKEKAGSPAVETEMPLQSPAFSPLMTKPPVPLAIAERSIAVLSFLPKTSSVKPTTQQLTYLLLPVAQEALLLTVRVRVIGVASPPVPIADRLITALSVLPKIT
jgi:hypothetical protein